MLCEWSDFFVANTLRPFHQSDAGNAVFPAHVGQPFLNGFARQTEEEAFHILVEDVPVLGAEVGHCLFKALQKVVECLNPWLETNAFHL